VSLKKAFSRKLFFVSAPLHRVSNTFSWLINSIQFFDAFNLASIYVLTKSTKGMASAIPFVLEPCSF